MDSPFAESTTGFATGIDGNRFGGLTTIFDFFAGLDGAQQNSLLSNFGAGTVTKVIGSAQADTHTLSSVAKEYVLGKGDNVIAPTQVNFLGIHVPGRRPPKGKLAEPVRV